MCEPHGDGCAGQGPRWGRRMRPGAHPQVGPASCSLSNAPTEGTSTKPPADIWRGWAQRGGSQALPQLICFAVPLQRAVNQLLPLAPSINPLPRGFCCDLPAQAALARDAGFGVSAPAPPP